MDRTAKQSQCTAYVEQSFAVTALSPGRTEGIGVLPLNLIRLHHHLEGDMERSKMLFAAAHFVGLTGAEL